MAKDNKDIEGDEEEAGGGKKKLILIIVGAVLLLAIGGGVAFFLMGGEDDKATQGEGGEEAAEETVVLEEGEPTYVEMEPQFVVNLPEGGPAKMLQLGLTVYTRHLEVSDWLTTNDPMLRHHLIELLEQQDAATLLTVEGKQALQTAILELLSSKMEELEQPGEIKGVFFTEFVLQ